jgi:hypothetical protein
MNIKEQFEILLDWSMAASFGDFKKFIKNKNSNYLDPIRQYLREIYHLDFESEHTIIIDINCNKMELNKTFNTNNENITISDTKFKHSNIQFRFKSKTNKIDHFDPFHKVDIFCRMVSIFKKEFEYHISGYIMIVVVKISI